MSQREPSDERGHKDGDAAPGTAEETPKNTEASRPAAASRKRAPTQGGRAAAPRFHAGGLWRRLGAAMVDLAVIVPVALILAWFAGQLTGVHLPDSRNYGVDFWLDLMLGSDPALLGFFGLLLATALIYVAIFQVTWAATPGMRVLGLGIIDLYGDAPSVTRVVARTAGYLAATATLGLGFLWIGFDRERRGLHDWISGTHVVKV